MKIAVSLCLVPVAAVIICAVALYFDARAGYEADKAACPLVTPSRAAEAVIHDIIGPGNHIFSEHQLARKDITVDMGGVQIGPTTILVPFRLSTEPDRHYFGMPRCAVLSSVEYAHD